MLIIWGMLLITGQVKEISDEPFRIAAHLFSEAVTAALLILGGLLPLRHHGQQDKLHLVSLEDTLTVPLLDKDGILPMIPTSNDSGYWIKPPTYEEYHGSCNGIWWCRNNVAKCMARDQLSYAMLMYMEIVHIELERMVEWYIPINNGFSVTSGMWGKYFKKYQPSELYEKYAQTFSDSEYGHLWASIFTACDLFHTLKTVRGTFRVRISAG